MGLGPEAQTWLVEKTFALGLAIILILVAFTLARVVRGLVIKGTQRAGIDPTVGKFLGNLAKWAIIIFSLITIAGTMGISTASLAAVVAATGLAVGLALQGNLGNLASGVLLLVFRPFKIGDAVIAAGQSGVVDGIDLFTTNLDTADNRRIIIPNGAIFGGVIENQSHHPRRCIAINVPVSPLAPEDQIKQTLEGAVQRALAADGALKDPAPSVGLAELFPATVYGVTLWAHTPKFLGVRQALLREIKRAVEDAGIAPPPPVQFVKNIT
jgi:small conductance mechanosensitive channel